jgi:hypothetical protein
MKKLIVLAILLFATVSFAASPVFVLKVAKPGDSISVNASTDCIDLMSGATVWQISQRSLEDIALELLANGVKIVGGFGYNVCEAENTCNEPKGNVLLPMPFAPMDKGVILYGDPDRMRLYR